MIRIAATQTKPAHPGDKTFDFALIVSTCRLCLLNQESALRQSGFWGFPPEELP